MHYRPHLFLPLIPSESRLEWAGRLSLLGLWLAVVIGYWWLPARIPTHFGSSGVADHFGDRGSIIIPPLIATVLFWGLTKLGGYSHIFNYPYPITPANAKREYRAVGQLVRGLKLEVVLVFAVLTGFTFQASLSTTPQLPNWLLTAVIVLAVSPGLAYLFMAWHRHRRYRPHSSEQPDNG